MMGKTLIRSMAVNLMAASLAVFSFPAPVSAVAFSVHHDLVVTLDPENQQLKGLDTLKLRGWGEGDLIIRLALHARIISVSLENQSIPFNFKQGRLQISSPHRMGDGELELTLSYEALFRDPVPVDPIQAEDPSYGITGIIALQGTFLLSEAGWYPHIPGGSSTFRVRVVAPAGHEAVTAGRRVLRKTEGDITTSIWEVKHETGGIGLSAGPYVVRESRVGEIPTYTYFFPEEDPLSATYLKAAGDYLRFYVDLFGPYPFEKFAVVENFFPTGYGFPSYTLLGKTVIRLPFIVKTSLGHEVAHAWWGNGVLVDYEKGNWSEGLTSYVADYLFQERSSPEEGQAYRLKVLRDYAALVPREEDFPLKDFVRRVNPATRAVGYGKSAMVFHMARGLTGDDAFWKSLRGVFYEKLFQKASWDDFATAMTRASGHDLSAFFQQWVSRPGAPTLRLDAVRAQLNDEEWIVSARVRQEPPYYDLLVPVRLETQTHHTDQNVFLSGQAVPVTFHTKVPPMRLVVDPEADLFRRLDSSEVPPVVNSLKGSTSLLVVASGNLPAETVRASEIILAALGHENAPVIVEGEATEKRLHGHDILYLGLPAGDVLPSLPAGFSLSASHFSAKGRTYENPDDALFLVFARQQDPGRVAGLFLPLSDKAALMAARKISHYGKYSFLVFRDGVNQDKGTWPVSASPLIHVFAPKEVSS
jgi:hypothetical protein